MSNEKNSIFKIFITFLSIKEIVVSRKKSVGEMFTCKVSFHRCILYTINVYLKISYRFRSEKKMLNFDMSLTITITGIPVKSDKGYHNCYQIYF